MIAMSLYDCLSDCAIAYDNIILIARELQEYDRMQLRCVSRLLYNIVDDLCVNDAQIVLLKKRLILSFIKKSQSLIRPNRTNFKKKLTRDVMMGGFIGAFKFLLETGRDLPIPHLPSIGRAQLDMLLLHHKKYGSAFGFIGNAFEICHAEYITAWLSIRGPDNTLIKRDIWDHRHVIASKWEPETALALCARFLEHDCQWITQTSYIASISRNSQSYLRLILKLIPHTIAYDFIHSYPKDANQCDSDILQTLQTAADIRAIEIAKMEIEREEHRKELLKRQNEREQKIAVLYQVVGRAAERAFKGKKMKFDLTPRDIMCIDWDKRWMFKYTIQGDVYVVNGIENVHDKTLNLLRMMNALK